VTESHRRQLIDMVARPEDEVDLARASLLVACDEYPQLEVDPYLQRLDAMAQAVGASLADSAEAAIAGLNRVLFEEEGFRGNTREYYDPRNSFLNDVLDRRTGIPISLCTVYIAVGRRAGIAVHGVGLPGHFVVRVRTAGGDALVDPFHGGTVLTPQDCQARLDRIYGGRVRMAADMLAPCPPRSVLSRTLRNLKAIYLKADDHERALRSAELLVLLNPGAVDEIRDRGLVLAALECYALAAADLETYVQAVGSAQAPETPALRARIAELRHKAARLN
jgi:regulator of sirC expression with transglutaminase-like and TPR domain